MVEQNRNSSVATGGHLVVRNNLSEIATATEALEAFSRASEVPDGVIWRIQLALEELLRNIISHAYPDRGEHQVEIAFARDDTHVTTTISDDGIPFNPLNAPPPDLDAALEERSIGGLGIHLARNVVDDFAYAWNGGRNVVTIRKRL